MSIRFFEPWPALRGVIARIYAHESPAAEVAEPRWLIVPDGEIKLIFPIEGDIACTIGEATRRHRAARVILSGMRTMPGRLEFPQGVAAIGVIIRRVERIQAAIHARLIALGARVRREPAFEYAVRRLRQSSGRHDYGRVYIPED